MTRANDFIELKNVIKIYKAKGIEVIALSGLDVRIQKGAMVTVIGSSGSGKSTMMNLIGGLDQATAGQVVVKGIDLNSLNKRELNDYRRKTVGFIWQNTARNLVPYLNAIENVEMAMMVAGRMDKPWAKHLLSRTGLDSMFYKKPGEMSGGQQQRVALAVSLANRPEILLADEPTGAVDTATAEVIISLMRELRDEMALTVLIVTHDPRVAAITDRTIAIRDGRVVQEAFGFRSEVVPLEEALNSDQQELIVMDDKGRLQLPKSTLESASLTDAKYFTARAEDGRIILTREDP